MIVLKPEYIREWELYTMNFQGIDTLNLMENAAQSVVNWLQDSEYCHKSFIIFCGKGNNGGDGLAIARLLRQINKKVVVYILENGKKGAHAFQHQLQLLRQLDVEVHFYSIDHSLDLTDSDTIIIDALFGIGLNKPLTDLGAALVHRINQSPLLKISIDIPSGMYADRTSKGNIFIYANETLTFQCLKPAFLMSENAPGFGNVHVLNIELLNTYLSTLTTDYQIIDNNYLKLIHKKRKVFSHKGSHGHALMITGSKGMMGAAVLSAKACMRSGIGKLSLLTPPGETQILQQSIPEAICLNTETTNQNIYNLDLSIYHSIGMGPGIGMDSIHQQLFETVFTRYKGHLLLDADALNYIAKYPSLLSSIPPSTIITPHPKELERLFGKVSDDFERLELIQRKAKELNIIIVLKGKYTLIATPDSSLYVNYLFGNPGLAKAGTGDVLAGIITSFLGQGYNPVHAACLGVALHAIAADIALGKESVESLLASDLIDNLGKAFITL